MGKFGRTARSKRKIKREILNRMINLSHTKPDSPVSCTVVISGWFPDYEQSQAKEAVDDLLNSSDPVQCANPNCTKIWLIDLRKARLAYKSLQDYPAWF